MCLHAPRNSHHSSCANDTPAPQLSNESPWCMIQYCILGELFAQAKAKPYGSYSATRPATVEGGNNGDGYRITGR